METSDIMDTDSAAIFEEISLLRYADENGNVFHYDQYDRYHRVYGPAIIWADGDEWWYQNGEYHRLDGPAATLDMGMGKKVYFIKGTEFTEEEYWKEVERLKNEKPK